MNLQCKTNELLSVQMHRYIVIMHYIKLLISSILLYLMLNKIVMF